MKSLNIVIMRPIWLIYEFNYRESAYVGGIVFNFTAPTTMRRDAHKSSRIDFGISDIGLLDSAGQKLHV